MPLVKPEPIPEEKPGWFAADSVIIPFLGSPIEEDQAEAIAKHQASGFYFDHCGNMEVSDNTLTQAIAVAPVPGSDVDMVHNMGRSSGTITITGIYTDKDKFEFLRDLAVSGSELKFRSQITGSWMIQIKNPQFGYSSQRQGRFTFSIQMQCVRSLDKMNTEEAALQRLKLSGLLAETELKGKCPSEEEVEYKTIKVVEGDNLYDIAKKELVDFTTEGDPGDRWYEIAEINSPVDEEDPTQTIDKPPLLDPFAVIPGQELRVRLVPSECIGFQKDEIVDQIVESTGLLFPEEEEQSFIFIQPRPSSTINDKEFYGIVRLPTGLEDVELIVGGIDARFARGGGCRSVLQGLQTQLQDPRDFFEDLKSSPSGEDVKEISESNKVLADKVQEIRAKLGEYFAGSKFAPNFKIDKSGSVVTGTASSVSNNLDQEGLTKLAYYVLKSYGGLPKTNSYEMFEVTDEFAKEQAFMIPDVLWGIYSGFPKYITKTPIILDDSIPGIYQFTVLVKGEVLESVYINFKPLDKRAPDIFVDRESGSKIPVVGYDTGSNAVNLSWMRPVKNEGDGEISTLKYKIQPTDEAAASMGDLVKISKSLSKKRLEKAGTIKGTFKHPSGYSHSSGTVKVFKGAVKVFKVPPTKE